MEALTPVKAIPRHLVAWRWAGLTYYAVAASWPFTTISRTVARTAKEWIRRSVVQAIENGHL